MEYRPARVPQVLRPPFRAQSPISEFGLYLAKNAMSKLVRCNMLRAILVEFPDLK